MRYGAIYPFQLSGGSYRRDQEGVELGRWGGGWGGGGGGQKKKALLS